MRRFNCFENMRSNAIGTSPGKRVQNVEQVKDASIVNHEDISFDSLEFLGLIVPVLFAIFAIVLVAMSPHADSTASQSPTERPEPIVQIHKR
ncbi:hypothetical protein SAMN05216203_2179 [Marinobacter daqiaonensis]|uniref:Uncharacterized protein n=1 Tax=Marinobacter daqiaonensis TaxID=650891 RepID=A0A1I6IEG6_9GAMM|nr:hypothetical protein [Marinobacter daqiaonensis]SFR65073.1 hypothetical protein SAMN05216203_2179 [Marinobacter daqiaonensis]